MSTMSERKKKKTWKEKKSWEKFRVNHNLSLSTKLFFVTFETERERGFWSYQGKEKEIMEKASDPKKFIAWL